ncbi:MAG: zinc ribbon domain-containing protein [Akkermansiaceae bacterium]|nr:zinc ribbon domain-containing protein [Akkermansiaceae bacterium]MCF7731232.1 zinc ribbon domain-containing protein [Akkermansiaceae bacterium]
MPRYDYECQKCGNRFEVTQSMNDPKLEDCPEPSCDGRVKRLLGTGAGVIFKGSGFYQTDYRSASYQAGAKADTAPKPDTAKPDTAKPDTAKPDTAPAKTPASPPAAK